MLVAFADMNTWMMDLAIVGGGAVAGGVGAGWTGHGLAQGIIRRPLPGPVAGWLRVAGGALSGLLAWLFVFGTGGMGLGTGGFGVGNAGPDSAIVAPADSARQEAKNTDTPPEPVRPPTTERAKPQTAPATSVATAPEAAVARVEMLGEDRVGPERRFYKLNGGPPQTFDELFKTLRDRQKRQPPLDALEIVMYLNSVTEADPAVTRLMKAARQELRLKVDSRVLDRDAP